MLDKIPCEICGALFTPGSGYAKYCGDTCKAAAKKRQMQEYRRLISRATNRAPRARTRPTGYVAPELPKLALSNGWWKKPRRTYPCSACGHGHRTERMVEECGVIYERWEAMEDEINGYRTLKWG